MDTSIEQNKMPVTEKDAELFAEATRKLLVIFMQGIFEAEISFLLNKTIILAIGKLENKQITISFKRVKSE